MISDEEAKKLRGKIKELEEENRRLKDIEKEKEKIEKEFVEFKAKHAITVENLKQAMKIKSNSKKKPFPSGAKKGHKGYARHNPERIDYIKAHKPCKCPKCNSKLTSRPKKKRSRYITDIKITDIQKLMIQSVSC